MLELIVAGLRGEYPKRADLFARNVTLYGVDMTKPMSVGASRIDN